MLSCYALLLKEVSEETGKVSAIPPTSIDTRGNLVYTLHYAKIAPKIHPFDPVEVAELYLHALMDSVWGATPKSPTGLRLAVVTSGAYYALNRESQSPSAGIPSMVRQ
jgi:hypothetical protein